MQLTTSATRSRHGRHSPGLATLASVCGQLLAALATIASDASALDPAVSDQTNPRRPERPDGDKKPADPGGLRDATTKHASAEFAGYGDSDHVAVVTPSVAVGVENLNGASLSAHYLVDVVSAASIDIVSTASARAGWGEVRHAGTLSGQYKPHDFGVGVGGSVSSEPDYLSYGAYAMIVKEFDEKNWAITLGYGFSHDTAGRCGVGGACTPFIVYSHDLERGSFNGGIAWVVNRESLASLSFDVVVENGDQSKPYRYIAMFAPDVAPAVRPGASIDWVNANRLPQKPLEQLPLTRSRFAATGSYAHRFETSTLRVEERVYDDTWGLLASSTDFKWIFDLGPRLAVWPHGRFHIQSPVNFWQLAYLSDPGPSFSVPRYRTGDRELGPLWTVDAGLALRLRVGPDADVRSWEIGLSGDFMYTSFLNDLYLLNREAYLGSLRLQTEW